MDKYEATRIIRMFNQNDNPTDMDEFAFIEACNYLIETQGDNNIMAMLGGYYYEKQKYDLAEKYYLMAHNNGNDWAADGLGYIYYYGRNGARDYKKAFYYYSISKEKGNQEAAMKIADMYHNGYGVEKNDKKYKELLLEIFEKVKDSKDLFEPYPEVAHRLAEIYINEGHEDDALPILLKAKSYIAQRIRYNPFWGNFIVCKRVVTLLYKIIEVPEDIDFFDLYFVLNTPKKVSLVYCGKQHIIESYYDEGEIRVKCGDKLFKSIENFLMTALFDGKHTYIINYEDPYFLEVCN